MDFQRHREEEFHSTFRDIDCGKIARRTFYELIKDNITESLREPWRVTFDIEQNDTSVWSMAFDCVSETKLIELQWKILHHIFPSGTLLKKMKIRNDDKCLFCEEVDTLFHFFIECDIANQVWTEADKIASAFVGKRFRFSDKDKLFGYLMHGGVLGKKEMNFVNKLNLISKFTISKFKYLKEGNIKLLFERQLLIRKMI